MSSNKTMPRPVLILLAEMYLVNYDFTIAESQRTEVTGKPSLPNAVTEMFFGGRSCWSQEQVETSNFDSLLYGLTYLLYGLALYGLTLK